MALYEFFWDCGRSGQLEGIFEADPEEVKAAFGRRLYFGEVLGKHSDIYGQLEEKDVIFLTDDEDFIKKCYKNKILPIGYNPLEFLQEEIDDD